MSDLFQPGQFDDGAAGPRYLQLHRRIAEAIASGRLQPGDSLPPEREMAAMTGLSRVTIRKGIEALVGSGQLIQRRGSGTIVAPRVERLEQALSLLTSFTEDMARRGRQIDSRWLARGLHSPSPEEVMALGLATGDRVARLERVRVSDGVPLAVEMASLPATILPDPESVQTSLYALLESRGQRPLRAVQRISAANLGRRDADLLGVAPGVAGLRIERVAYLASGAVVEFTRSLYRGDAYDFAVELKMHPDSDRAERTSR
ncbi:MAG: GntR family transcriptional regulator [Paracoccus sp. (in: a-proteobacteria)]|uniref:GntR family transcriptional regulator n=1 Tax=unclassified Paracoccus (in: a-proteobacteria) TaxID=2688777 RepID=UPI000C4C822B|nr:MULTISPECIES: GntR family transcriptional regulator [unclassified Paracoccus (in: a-proteobacteria)]MAN55772.1 phage tail protein [Paracoccus sp. (in: a-proteobacteria)]MBA49779.1 phage tail protein [Paracoccus sp. (in: a-proteobacteria)]MDB2490681.1 GntR family transcriptional regulator [Paracoccus sp. (in: a-proteobacteria)]HIC64575.1 GntR family transcriptional regulator [Paracoccus sp. (in: a-proteobacteria)]|tara:strand:+ start:8450 stop:9229 length:780 start_codon:yes stop_codon:yes gene_type:complete